MLAPARKAFGRGQWGRYLEETGIDKNRASKARTIYRTFAVEEDLAGLTLGEAYAKRQRKSEAEHRTAASPGLIEVAGLRRAIGRIAEPTDTVIHDGLARPSINCENSCPTAAGGYGAGTEEGREALLNLRRFCTITKWREVSTPAASCPPESARRAAPSGGIPAPCAPLR
jgi:hypothetical protein